MVSAGVGAIIGGVISAAAAGAQGVMQKKASDKAFGASQEQSRKAAAASSSNARKEEIENNELNREEIDVGDILEQEQNSEQTLANARLSGPGGVDPNALRLGNSVLLGE